MAHTCQLKLSSAGDEDLFVQGQFTDAEHEAIKSFVAQYERLASSSALRGGMPCKFKLRWTADDGFVETEAELPDDDTLHVLLHVLRPFILEREPASFVRLVGILKRRLADAKVRALLRDQQDLYSGKRFQSLMVFSSGETVLNSERVLFDWLNSHEYHSDAKKKAKLDQCFNGLPASLTRGMLVSMLVDKVNAIKNVASLCALVLGMKQQLNFASHELRSEAAG